ncbi:MAG: hypothetical protein ACREI8_14190 [Myxococcota bacterium]
MREREPTSTIEDLEIEVDGETHRGKRVVLTVSDTEIRQEIRYESLRQVDPESYAQAHTDFMSAIAREILWRLVAQWKAGWEGERLPAKVEPGPRRQGPAPRRPR